MVSSSFSIARANLNEGIVLPI